MTWQLSGSFSGYDIVRHCPQRSTHYFKDLPAEGIPVLASRIADLQARGFTLVANGSRLNKQVVESEGHPAEIYYWLEETAYMEDGKVKIRVRITSKADSPELAIANAQAVIPEVAYAKSTVEGGKGQMKRCAQIAAEVFNKYGDLIEEGGYISIPYWTAGGRGGWKTKKAYRCFDIKDLKQEAGDALQGG